MAALPDIPIRLKAPADYRQMIYDELMTCLNDLNAIERFIPVETYRLHKALIGSLMANQRRRKAIAVEQQQIDAAERHIIDIETRLQS